MKHARSVKMVILLPQSTTYKELACVKFQMSRLWGQCMCLIIWHMY